MALGPHNNHKSGKSKIQGNVGYYVSNTYDLDKLTIKQNLEQYAVKKL